MKKVLFFLVIVLSFCCTRSNDINGSVTWFHIEITNPKNMDCGYPEIVFLTNQNEAYQIIGNDMGTYIALGLPKVKYYAGQKFWARIRKPGRNEMVICHALGFAWAHVFIADNKKWD